MSVQLGSRDLSRFQCIEMAVYNTAGLTGTFAGMNLAANYAIYAGNGFQYDIKVFKIFNASNTGITVSYDGVTRHDFWPAGATLIIDLQANHADNSAYGAGTLYGGAGQIVYGSGAAGAGNLYISGYR